jgi:putative ABC transport system permease protein
MKVYGGGLIISESLGINSNQMLRVGLCIGNALSAIGGALITQVSGNFSINMGSGALIFGLATIIIGEKIIAPRSTFRAIAGCFIGALIYKVILEAITFSGGFKTLGSEYKSLIISVVLIFLMNIMQKSKNTSEEKS